MVSDEELAIRQEVDKISANVIESIIMRQAELAEMNLEIDNVLLSIMNETLSKNPLDSLEIAKAGKLFCEIQRDRSESIEKYLQQIKELRS